MSPLEGDDEEEEYLSSEKGHIKPDVREASEMIRGQKGLHFSRNHDFRNDRAPDTLMDEVEKGNKTVDGVVRQRDDLQNMLDSMITLTEDTDKRKKVVQNVNKILDAYKDVVKYLRKGKGFNLNSIMGP